VLTVIATFTGGTGKFVRLLLTVIGGLCIFYTLTNELTIAAAEEHQDRAPRARRDLRDADRHGLLVLFGFLTVITHAQDAPSLTDPGQPRTRSAHRPGRVRLVLVPSGTTGRTG
jgi:hypothetical protein